MRVEKRTTISAPPEKVFAYLSDFKRHPEWSGHGLKVTMSDGPVGVGTTCSTESHQLGKQNDTVTVTEFVPGKRIVFETKGKAGAVRHWFDVSDAPEGSAVAKGMEFVSPSLPARLASPGIRLNLPRALAKDLARIKALVEGTS